MNAEIMNSENQQQERNKTRTDIMDTPGQQITFNQTFVGF